MDAAMLPTVILGGVAAIFSGLALKEALALQQRDGRQRRSLIVFWVAVTGYMASFALLRTLNVIGLDSALFAIYVAQTLFGASTIVALASIIFGTLLRPWHNGFAAGLFFALAVATITLIFAGGVLGPFYGRYGLEFLPELVAARHLVGFVYVATPVVMASIIVAAFARAPPSPARTRILWFAASVVMMFVPSAVRYVVLTEDAVGLLLAAASSVGTWAGWYGYRATR